MAQLTISGLKDATAEGYREIADKYGVNINTIVKPILREGLKDAKEDIPTWVEKEVEWEDLLNENRWRMRVTYFESRVREQFTNARESDPMPPPERLEWSFVESARDEVVTQAPERWREDMAEFLDREMARYSAIYHASNRDAGANPRDLDDLIEYAKRYVDQNRTGQAVAYAEVMAEEGYLPEGTTPRDIVDRARHESEKAEWNDTLSADVQHD